MKMSDRRLKRILRENQLSVQPERKEEMLEFAWMKEEEYSKKEDGFSMKYMKTHKICALIAAVMILFTMACAISAGIAKYYYHTPGGNIIDQDRNFVDNPDGLMLKMTEKDIRGNGYTITEVNWTSVDDRTTFTVWVSADSIDLKGLRANIGDTEYPLKKTFVSKDENGNPLNYGYTSLDVPEPESFEIRANRHHGLQLYIDKPEAWHTVFFVPEDCEPVGYVCDGVSLTGYYYDDKLYLGTTDTVLENSELNELIENTVTVSHNALLTGNDGEEYVQGEDFGYGGGVGEGSFVDAYTNIPGIVPRTLHTKTITSHLDLLPVEGKTYCDLPIPEPGETLTGEWKILDVDGITFTITKITREDKNTITFTTPDEIVRHFKTEEKPVNVFSKAVSSLLFGEELFVGDPENSFLSMRPYIFEEGYYYRFSSKFLREYSETHDTIPFGISSIEVQYSGDWTLTFPEN